MEVIFLILLVCVVIFSLIYSLIHSIVESVSGLKSANEHEEKLQINLQTVNKELEYLKKEHADLQLKNKELLEEKEKYKNEFAHQLMMTDIRTRELHKVQQELKLQKDENSNIESTYQLSLLEFVKDISNLKAEYQLSFLRANADIQNEYNILKSEHPDTFSYVASLMADYLTYNIHKKEIELLWSTKYHERQRAVKISEIRAETKKIIESLKEAQYQLDYILQLYPELNDVINYGYIHTPTLKEIKSKQNVYNDDPISSYLSTDEWEKLSDTEKNQLALDRYIESRKKSKWQIGRDYELYIGYLYEQKGYKIDYLGSYMGLEDLGRDLIAKKNKTTLIIQCKYWSKEKQIHEKHIMQLYGSLIAYKIEKETDNITGLLVTNIELSITAKKFADMLDIQYVENKDIGVFPRIKCNIGHDEFGETYIYHLPMDFQYDKTKVDKKGERMVSTVAEAEALGFRRTYKWHGNK